MENELDGIPLEIPDDCLIYRMVKARDIKATGEPISSCFCDNPNDAHGNANYMSVYARDGLLGNGWTLQKLYEWWGSQYRVFCFTAGSLMAKNENLWRAPMDEIPGHCACKRNDQRKRSLGQKRELARMAKLVELDYGAD